MDHPIDVIAQAIRVANPTGAARTAEVIAGALDERNIVDNAVNALLKDGWRETHDGAVLSDEDLTNIARTVLQSVSEAHDRTCED